MANMILMPQSPQLRLLVGAGSPTKWYICRIFLLLDLIAIFSQTWIMYWPGGAHKKKLTISCPCLLAFGLYRQPVPHQGMW